MPETGGISYWIYNRLGVTVGASDDELMAALDRYRTRAIKTVTPAAWDELRARVRAEHAEAQDMYGFVMRGCR